ncbi:radical SAM protein [bacterium]|nr:radical SAM protein [bacterium]
MSDLCHHRSLEEALQRLYPEDERRPNMMTLELTRRCNFLCRHCYCRLPANGPTPRPELTTEQWQRIIREAVDMGVLFALFTGGEPLLRPDFREIWRFARRQGLIPVLFTNGVLLDAAMADFLAEWTPRLVSITLYGASEAMYRQVTGVAGMHERALRAVDLVRERGMLFEVKSMVTRHSLREFDALRAQSAHYQDVFRWDAQLTPTYADGGGDPVAERLSPDEMIATELRDPVRRAEWERIASRWEPARPRPDTPFRCLVGTHDFCTDPYGGLHPCLGLEVVTLDLRQITLADAWEALPQAIAAAAGPPGPCQECPLPPLCRKCPGDSLAEGVLTGEPVEWRCELAQGMAEALGVEARPPL